MICRRDPRVIEEQNRGRRKKDKNAFHYEYSDHDTRSNKSCLTIPGINNHKRDNTQYAMQSNDSTTDMSSGENNMSAQQYTSDRKSLLDQSNQITNDWYMDDELSIESSQPDPERFNLANINPPPSDPAASLLTPPTPTDRSHDVRRREADQTGNNHSYSGELEPAGVRGQEAHVQQNGQPLQFQPSIPIRNFEEEKKQPTADSVFVHKEILQFPETPTRAKGGLSPIPETPTSPTYPSRGYAPKRQPIHRHPENSYNSTATETLERLEMMQNNITEITEEEEQRGKPPSPLFQYPSSTSSPSTMKSPPSTATNPSPATHKASPARSSASTPRSSSPHRSGRDDATQFTVSSHGTANTGPSNFRSSAPVDTDDSSFMDPVEHVQGIHAMAMEHVLRGEYDVALQAFSQVLQVYLQQYGRSHALTASAFHNLGTVHSKRAGLLLEGSLHQQHCREQALLCFQSAARSARDAPDLGQAHPNVAVSLVRIGFLLLQSRQYQNAVVTFSEALRIRIDHYGNFHSLVANLYNNLGVCHMHLQKFEEGRQFLQKALDIQKKLLGQEDHSKTAMLELADTLCNIGGLCLEWIRQRGPDSRLVYDAEAAFSEALDVRSKVLGETHTLTTQVRSLHDMVRSISLSVPDTTSSLQPPTKLSNPRSAGPSGSNSQSPARPVATAQIGTPSRQSQQKSNGSRDSRRQSSKSQSPRRRVAKEAFNPFEQDASTPKRNSFEPIASTPKQNDFPKSPQRGSLYSPAYSVTPDTIVSEDEASMNETTEEICLLQFGVSTFVSYAQVTSTRANSAQRQSDRLALMNNAKMLLNKNSPFDSPQRSLGASDMTPMSPKSKLYSSSHGQGLAPLGGTWPVSSNSRITPAVLEDPYQHLHTIHKCAANFMKRMKFPEALHLLKIILECQKEIKGGQDHQDVAGALYNVGVCHLRMDEHYEALSVFEEATRMRQNTLGRNAPQVAISLVKVGASLLLLRRLEDSLWIFREALTVRRDALGNDHPMTARVLNCIGCIHVELKQLDEARKNFETALGIQRIILSRDPDDGPGIFAISITLQNMGFWYQRRGSYADAKAVLSDALRFQEKVLGQHHVGVLETLDKIAEVCLAASDTQSALSHYKAILERIDNSNSTVQEATIIYKIAKVDFLHNDLESHLSRLQMASKVLQEDPSTENAKDRVELEHKIQQDMNTSRELIEKKKFGLV